MQKFKNFGYDETKKMLNSLRKLNENIKSSKTITEQEETPEMSKNMKDDITVINNVDVKLLSTDSMDMKLTEEQKVEISKVIDLFKQQVFDLTNFDPGMVVGMDQIRLDGAIDQFDVKFTLVTGKDAGVYVICDMTEVTPEFLDFLTKLSKFYQSFSDSMNNLIGERQNN